MRYKCTVSYDGSAFHGFQCQPKLRTVQGEIEKVLRIITKNTTKIVVAGRTDTGVHALGQVFHFDFVISMSEENMRNALNCRLPRDIYIKKVCKVTNEFHARYSAHDKTYMYFIDTAEYNPLNANYRFYYKYKLDIDKMKDSSKVFVGTHDFKSFAKGSDYNTSVRTLTSIDFDVSGTEIKITFTGNGFLHNMIRIMVAMMLEVGKSNITRDELQVILDAKNRRLAPKTAPGGGLYLLAVNYSS